MSRPRTRKHDGGSIDRRPSGTWRLRYYGEDGRTRHTRTFATKREASDYLTMTRADQLRGDWRNPTLGAEPVTAYAHAYLATRHDLKPRTRDLYARLLARWIDADLPSAAHGRRGRAVTIGARHLRTLTVADVREWHAAVIATATERAADRAARGRANTEQRRRHAARAWGRANGYPVARTGRLSPAVLTAWRAAGSPTLDGTTHDDEARPATVGRTQAQQAYRLLRAILNAALRDGLITANPCQLPGAGQSRPGERSVATPGQVTMLADNMPDRLRVAVHLAAVSGLRGGELFALARRHVDLDAGTVRVERSLLEVPGQPITFGPPKSDASRRLVHLPSSVVEMLREHMDAYTGRGRDALVFTTERGTPVSTARRSVLFARARARVGCDHLTWHSLRHTAATRFAQAGATTKDLQARIGHSTVAAAMIYQHASSERDRFLADAMEQLTSPTSNVHRLDRSA